MATRSEHTIKFRSDFRQFKSGFTGAQRSIGKFGRVLGGLPGLGGLLGGAGLVAGAMRFGEKAGKIRDLNRRTEIAIGDLQRLQFVADQTGTSLETFVNAYERLQKVQRDAARGSKQMVQAFKDLGIDPTGMAPRELFEKTTEALRGRPGAAGIARELLGRSGGELLQSVNQDIGALMKQAKVIDADLIERTATNMDALTTAMNEFTVEIAPVLVELVQALKVLADLVGWWRTVAAQAGTASVEGVSMKHQPGNWGNWDAMIRAQERTNAILEAED